MIAAGFSSSRRQIDRSVTSWFGGKLSDRVAIHGKADFALNLRFVAKGYSQEVAIAMSSHYLRQWTEDGRSSYLAYLSVFILVC